MALSSEQVANALNELITTCRDREEGYRTGAGTVKNTELRSLFGVYAEQSAQFSSTLRREAQRFERPPDDRGSAAGAVFRGWMQVKAALTGGDDVAVLADCERGEDSVISAYERAMRVIPAELQPVVLRQYTEVRNAHHRIRALRDAARAAE